ncbi:hypothetical protein LJR164_001602 [Phenylobacterium sp. LjRoot164]|uniref:hypothetical protein n=1 Tax=unclassified Phenylobacterium TaxID=2640670 RepID=UPI003ECE8ED8
MQLATAKTPEPIYVTHEIAYDGKLTTFVFADAGLMRRAGWRNGHLADGLIIGSCPFTAPEIVVLMAAPGVPAASLPALKMAAE